METEKSQCILSIWAGSRSAFSRKLLLCDADCAIFLLSVAVAEGVFLYRTESRNALLAVITFAVLLCFRPRRRRAEGKELNSRTDIWEPAFRRFASSPVLGAYCQISDGTGMSQLHNTHVDILVSYGTSVLVLTCVFLYVLMRDLRTEVSDDALAGFICVLLLGIGEAALFSGGLGITLFFGVFLGLKKEKSLQDC